MLPDPIQGIHHITAIASDPQRNLDFYTRILGLRLVKLTVNFDDPGTYHFYFGDEVGHPGTILTFFPWLDIRRGRHGTQQVGVISFLIPTGSTSFWSDRLKQLGISSSSSFERFDEEVLPFLDPDGLLLELVATEWGQTVVPWSNGPVPAEHAIGGFGPTALFPEGFEKTAELLTQIFRLKQVQQSGQRYRFSGGNGAGGLVDVVVRPNELTGGLGAGIVHHIAYRAKDDAEQLAYRQVLLNHGLDVTPVLDRQYFHSIYFREPGGILFEIATDPPGFTLDEPVETLGSTLRLPPWLESSRPAIEQALPPIQLPVENQDRR